MPLNAEQKKRMDKLDFSMGGGYSDFLTNINKSAPSDSKFLFIGLGGKGSSVVAGLKTEVYKKIQCPNEKFKPDNFEYLVIDTCREELEILEKGSFGQIKLEKKDSETFLLYDEEFAKKLTKGADEQPEYIKEWFNPTLTPKIVGHGAGGIRQCGRSLLFGGKFEDLWNALEKKLTRLHTLIKNQEKEKLIVYIFAGIGGGTGSGTIIDIPYIVREIVKRKEWSTDVYGYIFLPDTYSTKVEHMSINSYAALQEIDALMSLGDCKGSFKATYGTSTYSIESDKPIFDSCVLISGKHGAGEVTEPDKFTRRVVIDNIINLVSNTSTSGHMLANSFLDNNTVQIRNKVMLLDKTVPKNKFFQYLAIGIGAVELPMDQMMAYLAKGTFDKMREGWNQHASAADVAQELKDLNATADALAGEILNGATKPLFAFSKAIKSVTKPYENIDSIQNGQFFAKVKAEWMGYRTEMLTQWDTSAQRCTARVVGAFEKRYRQMFQDSKYGIYYLKELLSWRVVDNKSFNGIRECVYSDYYSTQMGGLIRGAEESERAAAEEKRLIGEHGAFFFPYEKYCKACIAELVYQDIRYLYDHYVRKCLEELLLNIDEKIKDLQEYVDIFTYLENIVTDNYNTAMKGNMPHAEYASILLDFSKKDDDASVKKVMEMLDEQLAQKTAAGLVTALEGKILTTEAAWLHSEDEFNPVKVFVEFLENQFNKMSQYTLDSFLQLKYNAKEFSDAVDEMCSDLKNSASVLFPADLPLGNLPHNNYIVLPASGKVSDCIKEIFKLRDSSVQIADSSDRNRIYWYNLVSGVPLFALKDIPDYESAYKTKVDLKEAGIHIFESSKMDWRKELGLLYNDKKGIDQIKFYVEKFLKSGVISAIKVEEDLKIDHYEVYGFNEEAIRNGQDTVVRWCQEEYLKNPIKTEAGLLDSGEGFMNALYDKFSDSESEYKIQKSRIDNNSIMFTVDNEEALCKAIRMQPFLYKRLQGTYEICKKCIDMIEAKNAELREAKEQKVNLELFANYMRRGIIRTDDQAAFYVDSEGKQGVLLYYNMISPSMKLPFKTYYVFEKFSKLDAELKANLAQYYESLLVQENEDASLRAEFAKNRDLMKADVQQAQTILNQYTTRKNFADIGEGDLPDKYDEFYRKLDLLS